MDIHDHRKIHGMLQSTSAVNNEYLSGLSDSAPGPKETRRRIRKTQEAITLGNYGRDHVKTGSSYDQYTKEIDHLTQQNRELARIAKHKRG